MVFEPGTAWDMAYSADFRAAALAAVDAKKGTKTGIAAIFGITRQCLDNWLARRAAEQAGTRPPPAKRGPKPKLDAAAEARLRELHAAKPDGTIAHFHRELAAPVHANTVWQALRRLGFTFKKNAPRRRAPAPRRRRPA
jgi:transposase